MGRHEPLTLSLDDMLDISFADELLSHFDLKRDSLHSPNKIVSNGNINKPLLTVNDSTRSTNGNKFSHVSPSILPLASQHQTNNDRQDSGSNATHDSVMTPATTANVAPIPELILSPEENRILSTTLPAALTSLEMPRGFPDHHSQHHEQYTESLHSTKTKAKSTTASLPGTIADRAHRRRHGNHNLLRRSSTYLRQKFFASAPTDGESTDCPPPLPTFDPISVANMHIPNNNSLSNGLATTVAPKDNDDDTPFGHIRTKTTSPLSPPPTPPSSCTPIIPSSSPPTITTTTTPVISPSQYPPKPLQYCPVDPPDDRHRVSFPIFSSWRKKSLKDPRRQSEPTISSQQIKTRRSFFFR